MYDPLVLSDLVHDELNQRLETGFDVGHIATRLDTAGSGPADLSGLLSELEASQRQAGWPYVEPDGLPEILAEMPEAGEPGLPPVRDLADRVHGAWLGRVAGCNLGKPVERGPDWTSQRIRAYLELAGAYPLRDYIPALDPMPAGFEFTVHWPHTTRGNIHGSARDDDIDYTILNLMLLETHGPALTTAAIGEEWLRRLPCLATYTAERAAYRNLINGLAPPQTATVRNPYREWIGATIRADAFGYVCAGQPRAAAVWSYRDARLSHTGNGIYGQMWAAALVAAAFATGRADEAARESLRHIPWRSRLAEAVASVTDSHRAGLTWDAALAGIQRRYGHYSWVHTVNNACVVTAALLWGGGDFATSVGLAVQAGWDTDCNGATVGSVMGAVLGVGGIPANFSDPLQDLVRPGLFGVEPTTISSLAARTTALAATVRDSARSVP